MSSDKSSSPKDISWSHQLDSNLYHHLVSLVTEEYHSIHTIQVESWNSDTGEASPLLTTMSSDNFYLVSIGLSHTAGARLGVAVQLAFSLGLHSDSKTAALGLDCVEIQLRRRVFWQLYCSDKWVSLSNDLSDFDCRVAS